MSSRVAAAAIATAARIPTLASQYDPEHAPIKRDSVHVPLGVLAERAEARDRYADGLVTARTTVAAELHRPQRRLAEIAVDVAPVERRQGLVPHHVPAGDRAVAGGVFVDDARLHRVWRGAAVEAAPALEDVPAVVGALPRAAAGEVDLLLGVLTDVRDHQVAGQPVEREAPRVTQAEGPDLGRHTLAAHERVALHAIGPPAARMTWIDPQ